MGSWNGMSSELLKCTTITGRDVLPEFPSTGGWLENRLEAFAYLCLTSWTAFLFCPEGQPTNFMSLQRQRLFLKPSDCDSFMVEAELIFQFVSAVLTG